MNLNDRKFTFSFTIMPPRKIGNRKTCPGTNSWQPLTGGQPQGLSDKSKSKFNWKHVVRAYQLQGIEAQLLMCNGLVHAGTGMGKTAIVAGPHAHESSAGKVTLFISPLIALQDEQVSLQERRNGINKHPYKY